MAHCTLHNNLLEHSLALRVVLFESPCKGRVVCLAVASYPLADYAVRIDNTDRALSCHSLFSLLSA